MIADERVRGRAITLGAGEHGLARAAEAGPILRALNASVADISDPQPSAKPRARPGAAHQVARDAASRRYPGLKNSSPWAARPP